MNTLSETLETKIKKLIIKQLALDISYETIDNEAPLFDIDEDGAGLDLDSVDALELVVGIKKEFNITIHNTDLTSCYNVRSIAELIRANTGE